MEVHRVVGDGEQVRAQFLPRDDRQQEVGIEPFDAVEERRIVDVGRPNHFDAVCPCQRRDRVIPTVDGATAPQGVRKPPADEPCAESEEGGRAEHPVLSAELVRCRSARGGDHDCRERVPVFAENRLQVPGGGREGSSVVTRRAGTSARRTEDTQTVGLHAPPCGHSASLSRPSRWWSSRTGTRSSRGGSRVGSVADGHGSGPARDRYSTVTSGATLRTRPSWNTSGTGTTTSGDTTSATATDTCRNTGPSARGC